MIPGEIFPAAGDIVLLALSLGVVILVIKNIRKKPVQAY